MSESFPDDSLTRESVAAVVDRVVAKLLLDAGVHSPPIDALALARAYLKLEIVTAERSRSSRRSRADEQRIVIAANERPELTQWAVATALGARAKADVLNQLGLAEVRGGLTGVSIANLFAARLLLPTQWFPAAARETGYDLLELQHRFSTAGYRTIAERLLDLPEPSVLTQIDSSAVVWRRSNAWRVPKALAWAEQRCRELVVKHGEPYLFRARGWTVQGWPVSALLGSREFLRTVLDEDAQHDEPSA